MRLVGERKVTGVIWTSREGNAAKVLWGYVLFNIIYIMRSSMYQMRTVLWLCPLSRAAEVIDPNRQELAYSQPLV